MDWFPGVDDVAPPQGESAAVVVADAPVNSTSDQEWMSSNELEHLLQVLCSTYNILIIKIYLYAHINIYE